ncbi:hypothetical protein ACGFK1_07850 [Mycobacterium sp. NPDC048908]
MSTRGAYPATALLFGWLVPLFAANVNYRSRIGRFFEHELTFA